MSGNIWTSLCCCQKGQDKDGRQQAGGKKNNETLRKVENTERDPVVHQVAHVNIGYLSAVFDQKESLSSREDSRGRLESTGHQQDEVAVSEAEERGVLGFPGQSGAAGPAVLSSEEERGYRLIKQQLAVAEREKRELEKQVHQANQSVRDLKHEVAVLQKRLQLVENPPHTLTPPRPPTPPPLPTPPPPLLHPLRSLLSIIQKKKDSKEQDPSCTQQGNHSPASPERATNDVSPNHQCPGMNEVLEMIRNGVSLRRVIQVQKGTFKDLCDQEEQLEVSSSSAEPELETILKRRKESVDHFISDGSFEEDSAEDTGQRRLDMPANIFQVRKSPGKKNPGYICQDQAEGQEHGNSCRESVGKHLESNSEAGDEGSTSSTLPVTSPLEVGQVDDLSCPPDPEGHAEPCFEDVASMDPSNMDPETEDHVILGAILTDLMTALKNQDLSDDGTALKDQDDTDTVIKANPHVSPELPEQSQEPQDMNEEEWTDVNLEAVLTSRSDLCFRKTVDPDEHLECHNIKNNQNNAQLDVLNEISVEDTKQTLPKALEDGDVVSLKEADLVDLDKHITPLLLQNGALMAPPAQSSGQHDQGCISSGTAKVLKGDFIEESVDSPQEASLVPRDHQPLEERASFVVGQGDVCPPPETTLPAHVKIQNVKRPCDSPHCYLPGTDLLPALEDERDSTDSDIPVFFC